MFDTDVFSLSDAVAEYLETLAWQPINHSWLQLGDWVIDLLHDQHGERHLSKIPVMVTNSPEFYGQCFVVHRRKAGITGVAGQTATPEEYRMIVAALEFVQ